MTVILHNFVTSRPRLLAALEWARARPLPLVLLALFVAALVPRLYGLDAQSLWLDEGGTWAEVTRKGWATLLAELLSPDAGYPLYHLLLKGWTALAGDSEWALRFPSAIAGAGVVVAVHLAAVELTGAGQRALRAGKIPVSPMAHRLSPALFVALSPFAIWHAQDAKAYSLLLLVAALELWALLRAFRRDDRGGWLLVLALALTSVFVHRLALLLAAGVALAVALIRRMTNAERRTPKAFQSPDTHGVRPARSRWNAERRTTKAFQAPPGMTDHERRTTHDERGRGVSRCWSLVSSHQLWLVVSGACAALGVAGTILAARGEAAGGERAGEGPLAGLGLVFARFSLDRWPGEVEGFLGLPALAWLLPFAALMLWGLALLARDAAARRPAAVALLCLLVAPLGLLALTLALAPVFQARYAAPAFPAWALVIAYPLLRASPETGWRGGQAPTRFRGGVFRRDFAPPSLPAASAVGLFAAVLLASALMLLQPGKGIFSGAPVKEQWRAAVAELAARAQPDDLLIVHPYYVLPLYDYYASRVTPDPLPRPATFPIFAEGDRGGAREPTRAQLLEFVRRRYEPFFNQAARGKKRALLLIAPEHARTVDPPPAPGDRFGWVGLRFQYPQRTWPCGGVELLGVAVMCQSFPEHFRLAGDPPRVPQPAAPLEAVFGGELRLRGYTLAPHGGALRPGGTLPLTLYWEAAAPPTRRYRMFLHLCRVCDSPPLANDDGPPLMGYPPAGDTTTWRVGDPVHDERALRLPRDLPPGRYTLLLGVYPEGEPAIAARLPVATAARTLPAGRLVLGEVEIGR
ncbi:MAG TPA: DUF2723 domain-containing protein [Roseiflexaceae bacterium]|nr:DUF2723 domain-containing protein [Roseiflexaceae bacterium]